MRFSDISSTLARLSARLDEYVTSKNLNKSGTRAKMLQVLVYELHHFGVLDLVDRMRKRYPDVSRATVYRNLPIFVECGILQEGPVGRDGEALYELAHEEHHDHIVCLDCRRIFEFHDETIEARQVRVSKDLDFTVKNHRHVVYVSCDRLKRGNK